MDVQIGRGQPAMPPIGPFDQPQPGSFSIQAEVFEFARIGDPVQVQVQGRAAGKG